MNAISHKQSTIFINELVDMGTYVYSDSFNQQILTKLHNNHTMGSLLMDLSSFHSMKTWMIFVERGIDVNLVNGTILEHAICKEDADAVRDLSIRGTDPNVQSGKMLYYAINLYNESIIKLLLDYNFDIKWIDTELLARMVNFCSTEFVQLLGKYNIDLTVLNNYDHINIKLIRKIKYLSEFDVDPFKIAEIMSIVL